MTTYCLYKLHTPHSNEVYYGITKQKLFRVRSEYKTKYIEFYEEKRPYRSLYNLFSYGKDSVKISPVKTFQSREEAEQKMQECIDNDPNNLNEEHVDTRGRHSRTTIDMDKQSEMTRTIAREYYRKNRERILEKLKEKRDAARLPATGETVV
jgi:hypothetical protein